LLHTPKDDNYTMKQTFEFVCSIWKGIYKYNVVMCLTTLITIVKCVSVNAAILSKTLTNGYKTNKLTNGYKQTYKFQWSLSEYLRI